MCCIKHEEFIETSLVALEDMFDSDDDNEQETQSNTVITQAIYKGLCMDAFNIMDNTYLMNTNDSLHVYGDFYKIIGNNNRYCENCAHYSINTFSRYTLHTIYENYDELEMDMKACMLGKQLNIDYGRMFCTFCDCYLYKVEFTDEMNCESCKHEMAYEDYTNGGNPLYRNHISYIIPANE